MQQGQHVGLPVRAGLHPTGLYLALRQIGPEELQDAFMQETIARVPAPETDRARRPGRRRPSAADTAPVGIIFHVARCGSTLISQSLKKLDDLVVYAEPQPVNEILAPPHRWPRAELVAALRTLGAAFARHARRPYVLKLSSWNTLYCDIVAEAFPDTPWVLSLRDPVEVGVSLLAQPARMVRRHGGGVAQPRGAGGPGRRLEVARGIRRARLRRVLRSGGASRRPPGRLVPTKRCPAAVWDIVAPHFSLPIDARQRDEHRARGASACEGADRDGFGIRIRRRDEAGRGIA